MGRQNTGVKMKLGFSATQAAAAGPLPASPPHMTIMVKLYGLDQHQNQNYLRTLNTVQWGKYSYYKVLSKE